MLTDGVQITNTSDKKIVLVTETTDAVTPQHQRQEIAPGETLTIFLSYVKAINITKAP